MYLDSLSQGIKLPHITDGLTDVVQDRDNLSLPRFMSACPDTGHSQ